MRFGQKKIKLLLGFEFQLSFNQFQIYIPITNQDQHIWNDLGLILYTLSIVDSQPNNLDDLFVSFLHIILWFLFYIYESVWN